MVKTATTRSKDAKEPKVASLPARFVPQFWNEHIDRRTTVYKQVQKRLKALKKSGAVDSEQKNLLAQRAVFVSIQLETMELVAAQGGLLDSLKHSQLTNTLVGLLRAIGFEKSKPTTGNDLATYVKGKAGRKAVMR